MSRVNCCNNEGMDSASHAHLPVSHLRAYNMEDLRRHARRVLPKGLFEYVDRGTENEAALRTLRQALERVMLRPRVLQGVADRSIETSFFGHTSSMPLAVAPTGAAGLLCFDGEIEMARAARHMGVPFILSTTSIVSLERVAVEAGGRLWFQLYMWPERALSMELVDRVKAAGYEALVVTADTPVAPNREYNRHNGFTLPMRITHRNALDVALHPRWFLNVFAKYLLRSGVPTLENYPASLRARLSQTPTPMKSESLNWEDLRHLRQKWTGPLIVKGILRADDALRALECGADGVVVSNHGGRNLDASVPPFVVLPQVIDAVAGRMAVFVDGGFNRGGDIVKAIAMGAQGVLAGRGPLWGLASDGEPGARLALQIYRDEIDRVMAYVGARNLQALDRDLLHIAAF